MEFITLNIFSLTIGWKDIGAPVALPGVFQLGWGAESASPTTGQGNRGWVIRLQS